MKTVFQEMRLRRKEPGLIGVEIEVEGHNLPNPEKWWLREHDGSLKAAETAEYVLARPAKNPAELKQALKYLDELYKAHGSIVDDSVRAGVHVHINCQDLTIKQLYTFICLYLCLENVLVKFCGEYREGNLFCLRASDAEYLLVCLSSAIQQNDFRGTLHTDDLRYASINVKALGDYGSLEFRAMRGTRDLDLIGKWALLLLNLKESSKKFSDPTDVINQFSIKTPIEFVKEVLGENEQLVRIQNKRIYTTMLYEGMRNAQDVAYCMDWTNYGLYRTIGGMDFPVDADPDEPLENV